MIGIFDSGIGGLTIFKAIAKVLPSYELLYLGDTARMPYGNRSPESIYQFTVEGVEYLFQQGCELVIVACNTMSAEALRKLQQEWLPKHYPDRRVLGVIRPIAEVAAAVSKTKRIGVVGTRATISSKAYERELQAQNSTIAVFQEACPLLVPLIEEGWHKRGETMKFIRYYLRPLKAKHIDTLILGCTHYPLLYKQFQQTAGKNITVLDAPTIVADKLVGYLHRHPEIESKLKKGNQYRFLVTDITQTFQKNAEAFLGERVKLEKVEL